MPGQKDGPIGVVGGQASGFLGPSLSTRFDSTSGPSLLGLAGYLRSRTSTDGPIFSPYLPGDIGSDAAQKAALTPLFDALLQLSALATHPRRALDLSLLPNTELLHSEVRFPTNISATILKQHYRPAPASFQTLLR